MTTTTPRRRAGGGLRDTLVRLAEHVTTPLLPADYLDAIDPLLSGAQRCSRLAPLSNVNRLDVPPVEGVTKRSAVLC